MVGVKSILQTSIFTVACEVCQRRRVHMRCQARETGVPDSSKRSNLASFCLDCLGVLPLEAGRLDIPLVVRAGKIHSPPLGLRESHFRDWSTKFRNGFTAAT